MYVHFFMLSISIMYLA